MSLYVVYARLFRQQGLYPVYARPWDYGFTLPDRNPWQDESEGG